MPGLVEARAARITNRRVDGRITIAAFIYRYGFVLINTTGAALLTLRAIEKEHEEMPEKPQLPAETIDRIITEETIRLEVREQLHKRKSNESSSRLLRFLNSSLGLFLLSTIFVTGLGGLFTYWTQRTKDTRTEQGTKEKLLAEYEWRLIDLDGRIAQNHANPQNPEVWGVNSLMTIKAVNGNDFATTLPEFKEVNWAGLIIQLRELGISDYADEAIRTTKILTDGPFPHEDSGHRGSLGSDVLDRLSATLHKYFDSAHKKIYG